jgi:hypothetical protein
MAEEKLPEGPEEKTEDRRRAYRAANRLISSAGVTLALSGIPPQAPEMEAIRRALRAVNFAGGIENPRKEAVRVFPPGARRFGRNAV